MAARECCRVTDSLCRDEFRQKNCQFPLWRIGKFPIIGHRQSMNLPAEGKACILILAAYAMGCFTSGYYLVKWRTDQDIRTAGSGSTGATNVSRALGRSGFAVTFLLDCLKGGIAVGLAVVCQLATLGLLLTMLAVVAGHIWPLQLRFRGGKGVATALGALLAFNYVIVVILAGLFLIIFAIQRNFVISGLAAFAGLPLALYGLRFPLSSVCGILTLSSLLIVAHRNNLPEEWRNLLARRKLKIPDHPIR